MSHYFDDNDDLDSAPERVDVSLRDVSFSFDTDRGVFSRGRLDSGTRLLLQTAAAPPPTGQLLDLGCGAGPIAITLALRSPDSTVWAVDVNDRARALAARNVERLGLANVVVAAPDAVDSGIDFGCIWSNPPIRIGKPALHAMLHHWLGRLSAGGSATLVVNKHLGSDSLHRWLEAQGFATARAASKAGYRLLEVSARSGSEEGRS